ncbi:hypothetical protein SAMN05216375_1406 [Trichococcus ilyis]|uniref:Uncharacterized protein n=1 Tax=Trichococcus ilyis TaxID=640938 RepID=A0A143Z105_9LACT|nr:Hypothetical protein TR210_2077 [Trichococcus ilyis]SEJ92680.1 hypothetical protein SAMN05216375_1406 [Trichococcus ilyis]
MWGELRRSRVHRRRADGAWWPEERDGTGSSAPVSVRSPEDSGNFRPQLRRSQTHRRTEMECGANSGEACVHRRKKPGAASCEAAPGSDSEVIHSVGPSVGRNQLFCLRPSTIWRSPSVIGVAGRPSSFSKSSLATSSEPTRMLFWISTRIGTTKSGTPAPAMTSA